MQEPLAEHHGNWRLVRDAAFSEDVVSMLQCPAYMNRTYIHQQTGDVVLVTVLVGPPGPITAHTPKFAMEAKTFPFRAIAAEFE